MEKRWKIIYYEDEKGNSEIFNFINSRSERNQAKLLSFLEKLEEKGPTLPRPYADYIRNDIYELRIKLSGEQTRILYFFCHGDYIILTHAFIKNVKKIPISEINKAQECKEKFIRRFAKKKLKELYDENL